MISLLQFIKEAIFDTIFSYSNLLWLRLCIICRWNSLLSQIPIWGRATERIDGPWVKTKHGPLAKQVVKGTLKVHQSRGSGGMFPREIF